MWSSINSGFRVFVALACTGVLAFGFYVLYSVSTNSSDARPVVTQNNVTPPQADADSLTRSSRVKSAPRARAQDQGTRDNFDAALPGAPGNDPVPPTVEKHGADIVDPAEDRNVEATNLNEPIARKDSPVADVAFEELDPAMVNDEVREKYAAGDHSRYRFVKIDAEGLRADIEALTAGDVLHIELFPGDVVSPIQGATGSRRDAQPGGRASMGGPIENHPCSRFNMAVNSQGAVDISSFHRHAPVFNVELTSQDSVYAITQSRNDNSPTCGD